MTKRLRNKITVKQKKKGNGISSTIVVPLRNGLKMQMTIFDVDPTGDTLDLLLTSPNNTANNTGMIYKMSPVDSLGLLVEYRLVKYGQQIRNTGNQ